MTILVEFGISSDRFELGAFISQHEEVTAELERIVPTDGSAIPYVWASGPPDRLHALTTTLEESELVSSVEVLDELTVIDSENQQYLYRIEWNLDDLDIIKGIVSADGEILEGESADEYWQLRFRFPDHENVADFYQYLADNGITDFSIDSIYELETRSDHTSGIELTSDQEEALLRAAKHGYFETPREITLDELGDELDITEQAVSDRIRRGTRSLVFEALDIPEAAYRE